MPRTRVSSILAAALVAAVAAVGAASCGAKDKPATMPIGNDTTETTGGPLVAADGAPAEVTDGALWSCQISDYDPQPCKFQRDGGGWKLTKLLGSQRFEGAVTFGGEASMRFVGQYFCPWGACDQAMDVTFTKADNAFRGTFDDDPITVQWDAASAGEWGGAGYGGLTGHEQ